MCKHDQKYKKGCYDGISCLECWWIQYDEKNKAYALASAQLLKEKEPERKVYILNSFSELAHINLSLKRVV